MPTSWSEGEKLDVIFQIIALSGGPIPWNKLRMPEGRTVKAAQQMIDKEKKKITHTGDGGAVDATSSPGSAKGKKRSAKDANATCEDEASPPKKVKTPVKKKTAKTIAEDGGAESPIKNYLESDNKDSKVKTEASDESNGE